MRLFKLFICFIVFAFYFTSCSKYSKFAVNQYNLDEEKENQLSNFNNNDTLILLKIACSYCNINTEKNLYTFQKIGKMTAITRTTNLLKYNTIKTDSMNFIWDSLLTNIDVLKTEKIRTRMVISKTDSTTTYREAASHGIIYSITVQLKEATYSLYIAEGTTVLNKDKLNVKLISSIQQFLSNIIWTSDEKFKLKRLKLD